MRTAFLSLNVQELGGSDELVRAVEKVVRRADDYALTNLRLEEQARVLRAERDTACREREKAFIVAEHADDKRIEAEQRAAKMEDPDNHEVIRIAKLKAGLPPGDTRPWRATLAAIAALVDERGEVPADFETLLKHVRHELWLGAALASDLRLYPVVPEA